MPSRTAASAKNASFVAAARLDPSGVGYKLGVTATPRDHLKHFSNKKAATKDPREFERRVMLDTCRTFGCDDGEPTFRYSLLDGVKEGFLITPTVVDARTEITTELPSEVGYTVAFTDDDGQESKETHEHRAALIAAAVTCHFEVPSS